MRKQGPLPSHTHVGRVVAILLGELLVHGLHKPKVYHEDRVAPPSVVACSMRIYTRTGDDGSTGLFGGARIGKDDLRIEAYGTIDELNAWIGKVAAHEVTSPLRKQLEIIQNELFTLGSHLATTDPKWAAKLPKLNPQGADGLESWMDELESDLPALKSFVLPGGHPAAADAHIARTVCRRAERRCVALQRASEIDPMGLTYLNRLSDALFMVGRWLIYVTGSQEIPWKPQD